MTTDKTPATLAVDVLEVLEITSELLKIDGRAFQAKEVDQARAVISEVIDVLALARAELGALPHSLGYSFTHLPRIESALARVKGESA